MAEFARDAEDPFTRRVLPDADTVLIEAERERVAWLAEGWCDSEA